MLVVVYFAVGGLCFAFVVNIRGWEGKEGQLFLMLAHVALVLLD